MTNAAFRKLALSFDSAVELPHFDKASFRVSGKIFATLDEKARRACLLLTDEDQALYCSHDQTIIYPVPNKWGKKGATFVELKKISSALMKAALTSAYLRTTKPRKRSDRRKPSYRLERSDG